MLPFCVNIRLYIHVADNVMEIMGGIFAEDTNGPVKIIVRKYRPTTRA